MRSSGVRVISLAWLALGCSAWSALLACGKGEGAPAPVREPIARVRAVEVSEEVRDAPVRAVGILQPRDELRLGFKVSGVIARIEVEEGDTVERGALLAQLDETEIAGAVERAQQAVQKANRDLERARKLFEDHVATRAQVDNLTTELNIARTELKSARFNLEHSRIEAPAAGLVMKKLAMSNELIAAGAPILVLGGLDKGWGVRIDVTDRDVVQLALEDEASVSFDAFPSEQFTARIERIANASDPATGTYEVELSIDPHGRNFVQGLVAKVDLLLSGRARPRLWLPVEALFEADGAYANVFVLQPGRDEAFHATAGIAEPSVAAALPGAPPSATQDDAWRVLRRQVRIGELGGDDVEIREGLSVGERVVGDGAAWLEDGALVTLSEPIE